MTTKKHLFDLLSNTIANFSSCSIVYSYGGVTVRTTHSVVHFKL